MFDVVRNEVQGRDSEGDEEMQEGKDSAAPKIRTAAVDDHNNWMLRVEVGGNLSTEDATSKQTRGVKLWAKKIVGDEGAELSSVEKDRLQID